MVRKHHGLNGQEFEQTLRNSQEEPGMLQAIVSQSLTLLSD